MKSRLAVALALALAVPAGSAFADARIEFTATEGGGASMQSLLIGHGRMRSDASADTSVILDPSSRSMTILDHGKRRFTRIGPEEMRQMSAALKDAMAQLEQAMANVPPEMRAQMQSMLGGAIPGMGGDAMLKITDTGRSDTVAGHRCTVFHTRFQDELVSESCMGDASVLDGLSSDDRAVLDQALAVTREMMEEMTSGPLAQFAQMTPFRDGMVPLRITDIDKGRRSTSEFAGIRSESLAADLFEVPSGYREQKIEMPRMRR